MTRKDRDRTPQDLARVAERLERERPTADPLELDRMKLQAARQAARGARSQAKGSVLKSRVAIAAILMLGLMTGGTGTTLALSGSSEQGSAAQSQYPTERRSDEGGSGERGDVLGQTQQSGDAGGGEAVQGSRQVVATETGSGSTLPFTGLAAIPLIVLGLALLTAGALLYRSARRTPTEA